MEKALSKKVQNLLSTLGFTSQTKKDLYFMLNLCINNETDYLDFNMAALLRLREPFTISCAKSIDCEIRREIKDNFYDKKYSKVFANIGCKKRPSTKVLFGKILEYIYKKYM